MKHVDSWKLGVRLFEDVLEHVRLGFSRTYDSDDPLTFVVIDPTAKLRGVHELGIAAGIATVSDDGMLYLFGRERTLATVAEATNKGIDGKIVLRGFLSDFDGVRSAAMERRLRLSREKIVSKLLLAHLVAEHFPDLRDWEAEGEIVLHRQIGTILAGGILSEQD